ncbi:unnamed protein product [Arabis nemorensis]|uniref:Armadillo repeat-containing domain-containing protein n=1 Tax=Arabis nemorensis TaxID=586526 RepID=A0A565CTJ3_9BRAS|nr:unnamed protein product [Arabis nemorensis]
MQLMKSDFEDSVRLHMECCVGYLNINEEMQYVLNIPLSGLYLSSINHAGISSDYPTSTLAPAAHGKIAVYRYLNTIYCLAPVETKERIVANLANFAYDPYNYTILRQLNVLELFIDCITEPNEKLVEFGIGGICNACAEPKNAATIVEADGIPLIIKCLSSPVRNTVNYALGALYYMCDYNRATREGIVSRAEVVDLIKRYAAAESVSVSFSNLAKAFLDKHVDANNT